MLSVAVCASECVNESKCMQGICHMKLVIPSKLKWPKKSREKRVRFESNVDFKCMAFMLKDLFRENFYFTIRFYTLRTSKIH